MLFCNFEIIKLCDYIQLNLIVGKKVEVSLRLFDIFKRKRVFIFLCESFKTHRADRGLQ